MLRSLLLFVHVVSAMGVFAALGLEAAVYVILRRASSAADVKAALQAFRLVPRVGPASLAGLVLSGLYLATAYWHWRGAWIGLGFLGLILTSAIGATTTGRRIPRLAARANDATLSGLERDPVLLASLEARTAILTGVVFLMTVKPGTAGSLTAMGIAIAVALLTTLMARRRTAARSV